MRALFAFALASLTLATTPTRANANANGFDLARALGDVGESAASRARLRCNACAAAADAVVEFGRALSARRDGRLKKTDVEDVIARACARVERELGLALEANACTERFSEDGSVARARGGWITAYASEACALAMDDENEDVFVRAWSESGEEGRVEICFERSRACASAEDARDANGRGARGERANEREL